MMCSRIVTLATAVVVAASLCGCATLFADKPPSDEELVAATLAEWKAALEARDIDKMMAQISEDFEGDDGGKPELKGFLEGAIDQGYLDNAEVDIEGTDTTIEGETASVAALGIEGDMGGAVLDLQLKKDPDGIWRITAMDTY